MGNDAFSVFNDIANQVVKKGEPTMSCCIYKDRAIVAERIRIALGGKKEDHNVIQVIDIACDECPVAGHVVTDLCRGCVAHACVDACKLGAITVDSHQKAEIDKSKCVECGKCAKSCPYSAIANFKRPCEKACKVDAISMAPDGVAQIDSEKCIECGACVYKCPFGATLDVSSITDIIKTIVDSDNNKNYHVHAIVAPAIAGQFQYAKAGQLISAIRELGFYAVEEVALGADIVAYKEAQELQEKGFLTSSCCPAFVKYIKMKFPQLAESYPLEIHKLFPDIHVSGEACPMWVSLVENNEANDPGADYFIKKYTNILLEKDPLIDAIILGCTHYPLLLPKIRQFVPSNIKVVSQGEYVAASLKDYLYRHPEMAVKCTEGGECTFYTTEAEEKFTESASTFLNERISVKRITLE